MQCPACGFPREPMDRFCSHCGAALHADGASAGSAVSDATSAGIDHTGALMPIEDPAHEPPALGDDVRAALNPGDAVLLVLRGPDAGARFLLAGGVGTVVTVGRGQDASIFLDDVTVSRKHVEFRRKPDGWRVVDVGSLNGTYVNRERIDDMLLVDHDEVQVGKYRFVIRIAEDS
jgi:hypothetical protein